MEPCDATGMDHEQYNTAVYLWDGPSAFDADHGRSPTARRSNIVAMHRTAPTGRHPGPSKGTVRAPSYEERHVDRVRLDGALAERLPVRDGVRVKRRPRQPAGFVERRFTTAARLVLHRGARPVTRDEVLRVQTPGRPS